MLSYEHADRYPLERHLKQTETIHPRTELGKFRGEPVFPRSSVVSLKSSDTWMRKSGRVIKVGEQALKMVKMRAVTVGKQRAVEMARSNMVEDGQGESRITLGRYR